MPSSPRLSRPRIKPDLFSRDPDRIEPQRRTWPARRDAAVVQIERCCVTGTKQASRRHLSKTKVRLFVRARALAGCDLAIVPDHEHIEPSHAHANDRLCLQPIQSTDRDPPRFVWTDRHIIHQDRPSAHARSRSARRRPRTARCGRSRGDRHDRTCPARRTRSARPGAPWCRHPGYGG